MDIWDELNQVQIQPICWQNYVPVVIHFQSVHAQTRAHTHTYILGFEFDENFFSLLLWSILVNKEVLVIDQCESMLIHSQLATLTICEKCCVRKVVYLVLLFRYSYLKTYSTCVIRDATVLHSLTLKFIFLLGLEHLFFFFKFNRSTLYI